MIDIYECTVHRMMTNTYTLFCITGKNEVDRCVRIKALLSVLKIIQINGVMSKIRWPPFLFHPVYK